jgi:hypothetical protein
MSNFGLLAVVLVALLYFVPTLIAVLRRERVAPVLLINLLLGWTVLGWIAALVISVWPAPRSTYVEVPYDGATYQTRTPAGHDR